ncbi:MAG: hypothetical protein KAG53_04865 [Endozoicomonadaceae bacterium]|nr:hypothetical protein [Endozoicomonadaceae bacterium]
MHSLIQAISHFNATFTFISPDAVAMLDSLREELNEKEIRWRATQSIEEIVKEVDLGCVVKDLCVPIFYQDMIDFAELQLC